MRVIGISSSRNYKVFGLVLGLVVGLVVGGALGAATLYGGTTSADSSDGKIMEFETMVGNRAPFIGSNAPIRGINAGGLPWQIDEAEGELKANGELEIEVEGLVLLDGPPVPEARRGTNPVPQFAAIVSCLSVDDDGNEVTVNVMTGTFPASPDGDAEIEAVVELPSPCIAPIVFVTSPGGSWFAATGS